MFRQTLEDKKNHERDFSPLTFTGEQRHFRLVSCPILARSGEAKGITMMLEDTTERHNVNQRLQQLHRLEAMGTLAGGVAHEINQPLSALHLYASGLHLLLEQQVDIPVSRIMERLSLILGQTEKIREIISHMRALVLHEATPSPEPVSVASGVEGALALVGSQLLAHGVRVASEIPVDTPKVRANRTQFEQVLINLLINAMHALDTVEREAKKIRISAEETAEGQVRIRVIDNGPGVQGVEEQIFTPFFSTKDPHQGMGLGLSIVHAFASAWGGEIRAHNNGAAPGATFTLTLRAEHSGEDGREEAAAAAEV
jgi:C4-dicarboxylate-specific signal transduction histidine kinase